MSDAADRAAALAQVIEMADVFSLPALGTEGEKQVESATVIGTVTQSGNVVLAVTANGMAGSPKTINVAVLEDDTAYQVAVKIRAALAADVDVFGFFEIGGSGVNVNLIAREAAANDGTMNLSIDGGTSIGLTDAPTSSAHTEGSAEDTTTIDSILDRSKRAQRWVAGAVVVVGTRIIPATANGHLYTVIKGGTLGSTEPFTADSFPEQVTDNGVVLEDSGEWAVGAYDVSAAVRECWQAKAAKASRFMGASGMNMAAIFDHCKKMVDYYQPAMVG